MAAATPTQTSPTGIEDARGLPGLCPRLVLLGLGSGLVYLAVAARADGRALPVLPALLGADFLLVFLAAFAMLALLGLAAAWAVFRSPAEDRTALGLILGFALLFRLLLLPTPPLLSSDVSRYLWDARVQALGTNPYRSAPADFTDAATRQDPLYQQQNRPSARTIYPPLAQVAFRLVRAVAGERVTAMKGLMVLADLATLLLLVRLLGELGLPRSRVIVYAWHPLAVFEVAGSGHVDALVLPCLLAAVLAWRRGGGAAVGVALGAGTLFKIYPILLLPAFLGRRARPMLLACAATILLGYLPFLPGAGTQVLGHLPRFLADPYEVFNPSLVGLILLAGRLLGGQAPVLLAAWIGRLGLLGTLAWLLRGGADDLPALLSRIYMLGAAVTFCSLTLHPWYFLWLIPFLAVRPRAAWIYLSLAVAGSYAIYLTPPAAHAAVGIVEYLPFLFLLAGARSPVPAGRPQLLPSAPARRVP